MLGISRSTFYDTIDRGPNRWALERSQLKKDIKRLWEKSKRRYGAPKIREELNDERKEKGLSNVGIKRIQELMRELGIRSITRAKYNHHSSKANRDPNLKNLLDREFEASEPLEKLVSDITYIHTKSHGWCYLATIMDLCTKNIIGWSFSKRMTVDLTIDALKKVVTRGLNVNGSILHSDRGVQYTAAAYQQYARKNGFVLSYSDVGCPYDNAPMESFNAVLKKELVHHEIYEDFSKAKMSLFQYIDGFYNNERIHGAIDYQTPNEALWASKQPLAS